MEKYRITNENVSFFVNSINVSVGAKEQEINDGFDNAEMDINIDWGENWDPCQWNCITLDYNSPDTSKVGVTTIVGYLDVRKFEELENIKLEYIDPWKMEQDKIPFSMRVFVTEPKEE